jgi:hypothetical protein
MPGAVNNTQKAAMIAASCFAGLCKRMVLLPLFKELVHSFAAGCVGPGIILGQNWFAEESTVGAALRRGR